MQIGEKVSKKQEKSGEKAMKNRHICGDRAYLFIMRSALGGKDQCIPERSQDPIEQGDVHSGAETSVP